nr:expressed protein [Hymenolepis microstoma]
MRPFILLCFAVAIWAFHANAPNYSDEESHRIVKKGVFYILAYILCIPNTNPSCISTIDQRSILHIRR